MIERKVSFTEFQNHTIERMIGAYASSASGVVRQIVQSYFADHGDEIAARLKQFEDWKERNDREKRISSSAKW